MPIRLIELVVRARRLVTRTTTPSRARLAAPRQARRALTQFSLRLAFVVDLAYIGIGGVGGALIGRATVPTSTATGREPVACVTNWIVRELPNVFRIGGRLEAPAPERR
jgi:hypothetical protein